MNDSWRIDFDHYFIDLCAEEDFNSLCAFIQDYWSKNHALAKSKELFFWQYWNPTRKKFNFALARDTSTNEILGVLGFIPNSHFDASLDSELSIWLSFWKVREDKPVAGIGMNLRSYLVKHFQPEWIGVLGINPETIPLYKAFGYETGTADQYFIVNESMTRFGLIKGPRPKGRQPDLKEDSHKRIFRFEGDSDQNILNRFQQEKTDYFPIKTLEYFRNRYQKHPIYSYELFAIMESGRPVSLFVGRVIKQKKGACLNVVDFLGPPQSLWGTFPDFQELLKKNHWEFLSMLHYGWDQSILERAGFSKLDPAGDFILPFYFEPFVMKNIRIRFAYKSRTATLTCFFKGDADQDRPSQIGEGQKC